MMKINISTATAIALFDEMNSLIVMSPAQRELYEELARYCQVNLEWHPTGTKMLPTICGVGWIAKYLEQPTDSGEPETSLFDIAEEEVYVLRGDHRSAVQSAAEGGLEALLTLFKELGKNPEFSDPL
jgi:hypothetical protein